MISSKATKPKVRLFAGPNGSGKTSLYEYLMRQTVFSPIVFINADLIERQMKVNGFLPVDQFLADFAAKDWEKHFQATGCNFHQGIITAPKIDSYVAAALAQALRETFLAHGLSFASETVFSHPSKLEFMRSALKHDFQVYLYFVATETPAINLQRIRERSQKGGHTVPDDKVIERYGRSLALLPGAISLCKRAFIFDNSGREIEQVAEYERGNGLRYCNGELPEWVKMSLS